MSNRWTVGGVFGLVSDVEFRECVAEAVVRLGLDGPYCRLLSAVAADLRGVNAGSVDVSKHAEAWGEVVHFLELIDAKRESLLASNRFLLARSEAASGALWEAAGMRKGFPDAGGVVHPGEWVEAERGRLAGFGLAVGPSGSELADSKLRRIYLGLAECALEEHLGDVRLVGEIKKVEDKRAEEASRTRYFDTGKLGRR